MAARAELELSWVQIFNLRLIQLYCPFIFFAVSISGYKRQDGAKRLNS